MNDLIAWLRALLRPSSIGWYIVTPLGDMGPFSSREAADSYPRSFRGYVDAPLFRRGYVVEYRSGTDGRR